MISVQITFNFDKNLFFCIIFVWCKEKKSYICINKTKENFYR